MVQSAQRNKKKDLLMKFIGLSLTLCIALAASANENDMKHRPKSFPVAGGRAVFVDFTEANYEITYDLNQK